VPRPRSVSPVLPTAGSRVVLRPVGEERSRITGGFWGDWQETARREAIPHAVEWLERDGALDNLRRLDPESGVTVERRGYWFSDSDVYKTLEALAWELGRRPDPALERILTDLTDVVARAQEPDGYVNSFVQAGLESRWAALETSHELYCIGHLVQAGIAHRRSTGESSLFDVARRAADAVVVAFGDGRRDDTDGHEEIELALVELFRETGEPAYLRLAQQLLEVRGHRRLPSAFGFDSDYFQDAVPVREQDAVVGHAVRALYLLAGMVDVATETGDEALLAAAIRQWESMVATKTFLTGAVGSRAVGEAFGDPYELPPDLAYGETCASIGVVMVGHRLLLATGESRFADLIERELLNLVAASTSADRCHFFYSNPAQRRSVLPASAEDERADRADAPGTRPPWFACACCPPNILRTVASLGALVATTAGDAVQVHQYVAGELRLDLPVGEVALTTTTDYPADGRVRVRVVSTPDAPWALELRIPAWAEGARARVAGEPVEVRPQANGYLRIDRSWRTGDEVLLELPMAPRFTAPHPAVDALRGTVAVERGPVVYALEGLDQPEGVALDAVEVDLAVAPVDGDPLDVAGLVVPTVRLAGRARDDADRPLWTPAGIDEPPARPVDLIAVPYAVWANRGPSTMRVFLPVAARAAPVAAIT
jgi:uncharacterized protein